MWCGFEGGRGWINNNWIPARTLQKADCLVIKINNKTLFKNKNNFGRMPGPSHVGTVACS